MRLVGSSSPIAQIYVHLFTVPGLERGEQAQAWIDRYYTDFESLRTAGLDALVITGANVANPSLADEPFWDPLADVISWAAENTTSVLCSCLATHALVKQLHGIERTRLPSKRWGVFPHRVLDRSHPLLTHANTRFDVPHSRWNEVYRADLERAGLAVLVESEEAGVHMAVSADGLRIVYFQGHPEYDRVSLLKEYKREVLRYLAGELDAPPPHPEHYFPEAAKRIADTYVAQASACRDRGDPLPPFPEAELEPWPDDTWGDSARSIFNNWLGLVYRLTATDRSVPFAAGIDPNDPLGWRPRAT